MTQHVTESGLLGHTLYCYFIPTGSHLMERSMAKGNKNTIRAKPRSIHSYCQLSFLGASELWTPFWRAKLKPSGSWSLAMCVSLLASLVLYSWQCQEPHALSYKAEFKATEEFWVAPLSCSSSEISAWKWPVCSHNLSLWALLATSYVTGWSYRVPLYWMTSAASMNADSAKWYVLKWITIHFGLKKMVATLCKPPDRSIQ